MTRTARVEIGKDGGYLSRSLVPPVGSAAGWEAALFDQFQAVVKTMCARLRRSTDSEREAESGGSTYSFTIWPGHPCEDEVRGLLREFRERHSKLRERIEALNQGTPLPERHDRVTVYGGLCVVTEEGEEAEGDDDAN